MPDLATEWGQEAYGELIGDAQLIIVDNLSSLVRAGGRENDAESWMGVAEWALRMRREGRAVLFIHHSAKAGQQRGTSKREDLLDCVMTLRRPPAYEAVDGAVFEVHLEKARDLFGPDAHPFEAKLTVDAQGRESWATRKIEDGTLDRVVSLAKEGLSQKEVAEELGIHKSNVSRAWKKAEATGLL